MPGSIAAGGSFPDYSQSGAEEVILFLRRVVPDEAFVTMIGDEERRRWGSIAGLVTDCALAAA